MKTSRMEADSYGSFPGKFCCCGHGLLRHTARPTWMRRVKSGSRSLLTVMT